VLLLALVNSSFARSDFRVRWPALFTDFSAAQEWKERVELLIHEGLQSLKTAGADVGQGLRGEQLAIHPEWNRHPESM
jgi:hypothetical protein